MLAAYLAVVVIFAVGAPTRVPSHFNGAGVADDWSSKSSTVVFMTLIGVGLPVLLGIPWPWGRWPALLNVPYKDHWIETDQRAGLTARVVTFMRLVGGLVCALMGAMLAVMLVDSLATGPADTAPGWLFGAFTAAFIVGIGLCVVKIFRDLKPRDPQAGSSGSSSQSDGGRLG